MTLLEIKTAVRGFLVENFQFRGDVATVADGTSLIKAGILDSVGILLLISFMEDTYAMTVGDDEVEPENLGSIESIAGFIARKTGAA